MYLGFVRQGDQWFPGRHGPLVTTAEFEAVTIHADRLEVTISGAQPLLVTLHDVRLRPAGTGVVVSAGGLAP